MAKLTTLAQTAASVAEEARQMANALLYYEETGTPPEPLLRETCVRIALQLEAAAGPALEYEREIEAALQDSQP